MYNHPLIPSLPSRRRQGITALTGLVDGSKNLVLRRFVLVKSWHPVLGNVIGGEFQLSILGLTNVIYVYIYNCIYIYICRNVRFVGDSFSFLWLGFIYVYIIYIHEYRGEIDPWMGVSEVMGDTQSSPWLFQGLKILIHDDWMIWGTCILGNLHLLGFQFLIVALYI